MDRLQPSPVSPSRSARQTHQRVDVLVASTSPRRRLGGASGIDSAVFGTSTRSETYRVLRKAVPPSVATGCLHTSAAPLSDRQSSTPRSLGDSAKGQGVPVKASLDSVRSSDDRMQSPPAVRRSAQSDRTLNGSSRQTRLLSEQYSITDAIAGINIAQVNLVREKGVDASPDNACARCPLDRRSSRRRSCALPRRALWPGGRAVPQSVPQPCM